MEWARFEYAEYWNCPTILVVEFDRHYHLLDAPFDEVIEDFPDVYSIRVLGGPPKNVLEGPQVLEAGPAWEMVSRRWGRWRSRPTYLTIRGI